MDVDPRIEQAFQFFKTRFEYDDKKYMKTVTRRVHPEMVDVEPGEKLMGVTFEKKDSCDLEEYKALQQRIDEIRAELEDDEDDDGDVVVRV